MLCYELFAHSNQILHYTLKIQIIFNSKFQFYISKDLFGGLGAYMEIRFFFSRSGHKIKVRSKLAKSTGTPSNSMCNDGKEENRHKQTHKWVWGWHHYPAYIHPPLYGNGNK